MNVDGGFVTKEYVISIIDSISDMIRIVTKDGKITLTNNAYDKCFAKDKSAIGGDCFEIFGEKDRCERCTVWDVMLNGRPQQHTRKCKDKVYYVSVSPLFENDGSIESAVEIIRDVTLDYNIKQNLLTQNAKMQRDLQLARRVQQSLIKNVLPIKAGYEFNAGFFPCEAVGGDIYDCIEKDGKLIMYVADVSGHGVMPCMIAVFFYRAVRLATSFGCCEPAEILRKVRQEFVRLELEDSVYITVFLFSLDLKTGEITYSNAGFSTLPILYDGNEISELVLSAAPISNWFLDDEFEEKTVTLKEGERLLIFSDGIKDTDTKGHARLRELFANEHFTGEEFIARVKHEVHIKPEDDLTLLVCERLKE